MTRSTFARPALWALVLGYSFFLAGHSFDITALVPNWRSGTPEDIGRYRDFLARTGPGDYFSIVLAPTLIAAILVVILAWPGGATVRRPAVVPLTVILIYAVWTQQYFVPINQYIGRQDYDPAALKAMVDGWVFWEVPRAGLVALGLAASIALLERDRRLTPCATLTAGPSDVRIEEFVRLYLGGA